jgi:hypothetical protein
MLIETSVPSLHWTQTDCGLWIRTAPSIVDREKNGKDTSNLPSDHWESATAVLNDEQEILWGLIAERVRVTRSKDRAPVDWE